LGITTGMVDEYYEGTREVILGISEGRRNLARVSNNTGLSLISSKIIVDHYGIDLSLTDRIIERTVIERDEGGLTSRMRKTINKISDFLNSGKDYEFIAGQLDLKVSTVIQYSSKYDLGKDESNFGGMKDSLIRRYAATSLDLEHISKAIGLKKSTVIQYGCINDISFYYQSHRRKG
jgi:hypothetical protein